MFLAVPAVVILLNWHWHTVNDVLPFDVDFEYIIFLCIADVKDVGLFSICVCFASIERKRDRERGICIAKTLTYTHTAREPQAQIQTNTHTHTGIADIQTELLLSSVYVDRLRRVHKMRRITFFLSLSICISVNSTVKICQMWSTYAILSIQQQTYVLFQCANDFPSNISLINTQINSALSAHCYCCIAQSIADTDVEMTLNQQRLWSVWFSRMCVCFMLYDTNWSIGVRTHAHTYILYVLALDEKRRETLLCKLLPKAPPPSSSSPSLLLPHAVQAWGHLFAISLFCPHAQCVYTHNVYIENTHNSGGGGGNHVLFIHHLSISLYSANGNGNSIECYTTRVRTLRIFPKSGEFSTFSSQLTHTHTHINSFELYFSFFFFFWVFPFPLLAYLWHTHAHTHYGGTTPQIAIQFHSISYIVYRFMRVSLCVFAQSEKFRTDRMKEKTERKENMFTYMSFSLLFGFYETHATKTSIHQNTIVCAVQSLLFAATATIAICFVSLLLKCHKPIEITICRGRQRERLR